METNPAFVLLAGGKSARMGVSKGLLTYKHTFWILEQLNRISASSISKVYIGLGFNYEHYFNAIPWFKSGVNKSIYYQHLEVKIVINKHPALGSFSTLQAVLKELNPTTNVVCCPIDVPILNAKELNKIVTTENSIVIPNFNKKNGHPIKISVPFVEQLKKLNVKDENARLDYQLKKVHASKVTHLSVSDAGILNNLNTKEAWRLFLKSSNA